MEISIDAAIPTVTDGLVFQILTIWQAIKMSYISLIPYTLHLHFFLLLRYLPLFCELQQCELQQMSSLSDVTSSRSLHHVAFS